MTENRNGRRDDLTFFPAYMILKKYLRSWSSCKDFANLATFVDRETFGHYDPMSDRSRKSVAEQFSEDETILVHILQEFGLLNKLLIQLPTQDELTRGIRTMFHENELPAVWIVFATQIFLDIHHVMREQITRGFEELQGVAQHACNGLKTKRRFAEVVEVTSGKQPWWSANVAGDWDRLIWVIETWTICDPLLDARHVFAAKSINAIPPGEPHYLLLHHPVLCGILSFHINFMLTWIGLEIAEVSGTMNVLHLYNALRGKVPCQHRSCIDGSALKGGAEDMVSGTKDDEKSAKDGSEKHASEDGEEGLAWPDMDLVINFHTEKKLFIGGMPTQLRDCYSQLTLVMGWPIAAYAANPRSRQKLPFNKARRTLRAYPPSSTSSPLCISTATTSSRKRRARSKRTITIGNRSAFNALPRNLPTASHPLPIALVTTKKNATTACSTSPPSPPIWPCTKPGCASTGWPSTCTAAPSSSPSNGPCASN